MITVNPRHFRSRLVDTELANRINYAQCWEDEAILAELLAVGPEDEVLSIASGGENSLALLLGEPRSITLVDLSFPQIAVSALKLHATVLPYEEYLQVLGLLEGGRRVFLYHKMRHELPDDVRAYWDQNEGTIRVGLMGLGRFERYLATFRTRVLPLVHTRGVVEEMLAQPDLEGQRAFYAEHWNTRRWRLLFKAFFNRAVMARMGRSKEHFSQVKGEVAEVFLQRAEHALTGIPIRSNPYVQWMLSGNLGAATKACLTREGHARLRGLRDRARFLTVDLESLLSGEHGRFSAFNLSNLFEYVPADHAARLMALCVDAARPGARMAWWNLLVPRALPEELRERAEVADTSETILRDRAFVYGAVHKITVKG